MSLFAAVLGLALSAPARAQSPAPSAADADQLAQAMLLYEEGVKVAKLGQWDKARTFYLHAWNVQKHWQIAANLGLAEANAGKHRDAAEHLSYFLREAPNVTPKDRKKTQDLIDQAKEQVGTLTITVNQDGAEVRVDKESVGTAPIKEEVFVEPGAHTIEAQKKGYLTVRKELEAKAGTAGTVALQLTLAPVPPPVRPPPPPPPPVVRPLWPVAVAAGAALVLLGSGAGLTVAANAKFKSASEYRKDFGDSECFGKPMGDLFKRCAELHGRWVATDTFSNAAVVTFVAGGVVALGSIGLGVWTWATPRASAREHSVQIIPALTTAHQGVVVSGTW